MVKQTFAKVDLYGWTSEVFLDVHGGPMTLLTTFETNFARMTLSLSHLDLSSGP